MRARMAVSISGQQVEFREVLLRDKPPSMIELSPKGTVPVLLLNSGEVIDESLDVIDWALNINDPEDWKRSNQSKKASVLIETNDNEFINNIQYIIFAIFSFIIKFYSLSFYCNSSFSFNIHRV